MISTTIVRARLQERLERGVAPGRLERVAARAWASLVRVERPLRVEVPTLCVGGATLGGSGKTPLALAATKALASLGHRVALVGHAYRARPERARVVESDDEVSLVGDEALECARELRGAAPVVVATSRQRAVDFAQRIADVLVLDGPLQLRPTRATLSWLAVDEEAPWGSGACPPAGDLRAPKEDLLASTDHVVPVRGEGLGVWEGERLVSWSELHDVRLGLVTAIARAGRVTSWLGRRGITPARVLRGPDHGPPPIPDDPTIALWLTTGKDWPRVERSALRKARIDYYLRLPVARIQELIAFFPLCYTPRRF